MKRCATRVQGGAGKRDDYFGGQSGISAGQDCTQASFTGILGCPQGV